MIMTASTIVTITVTKIAISGLSYSLKLAD